MIAPFLSSSLGLGFLHVYTYRIKLQSTFLLRLFLFIVWFIFGWFVYEHHFNHWWESIWSRNVDIAKDDLFLIVELRNVLNILVHLNRHQKHYFGGIQFFFILTKKSNYSTVLELSLFLILSNGKLYKRENSLYTVQPHSVFFLRIFSLFHSFVSHFFSLAGFLVYKNRKPADR